MITAIRTKYKQELTESSRVVYFIYYREETKKDPSLQRVSFMAKVKIFKYTISRH